MEWDLITATVRLWNHATQGIAVSTFPDDLDRDRLLARQILATVAPVGDFRLSSVRDAFKAVTICDLAKLSSSEFGVRVDSREALAVQNVS